MAMVENQTCDNCGRILFGKHGNVRITMDALEIKGTSIKTQRVDEDSGWRQYSYITPYTGADLAFCFDDEIEPLKCFMEYIQEGEDRARLKREKGEG